MRVVLTAAPQPALRAPPTPGPRTEQILRAVMVVVRVLWEMVDLHADASFQPWRDGRET